MSTPMAAEKVLDREFLTARMKLIDVAAILDRIDRADGSVAGDQRLAQLRRCLEVLGDEQPNRAERLQTIFSLSYEKDWKQQFEQ